MGCRILEAKDGTAVLYDSVTMWAFGNIFESSEEAEGFCQWLEQNPQTDLSCLKAHGGDGKDPREFADHDLENLIAKYRIEVEHA